MGLKIHEYPIEAFQINDEDFYDVDYWTGTAFESRKISGATIKSIMASESVNIYNADGTLLADRTLSGDNKILLFQTLGQFLVHSHKNNTDNIIFEVRSQSAYFSFLVKDHNTNDELLSIKNQVIEFNNAYAFPTADGLADQVLTTNGSGSLSFDYPITHGAQSLTETQRNAIVSPTVGRLIYNSTRDRYEYYNAFWGWHPIGLTASNQRDWGSEILEEFFTTSGGFFVGNVINSGTAVLTSPYTIVQLSTATNTNGGYRFNSGIVGELFGTNINRFEALTRVNTNSDATNTFQYLVGFWDNIASVNQVDGAYFLYDAQGVSTGSASSGNWQLITSSNSVRTFTTSSVAIDNTNLQKLRIDVNASGTSVEFYINDVLVGTHTTNIPTGTARSFGMGAYLQKSAGTTARTVDIDYLFYKTKFTTPR